MDLTAHTSISPIRRGFVPSLVNYKKSSLDSQPQSDKVYQLLAQGRWFSSASSITKTGRHDIAEILLKVTLKHQKSNKIQILNSIPKPSVNYAHIICLKLLIYIFQVIFEEMFSYSCVIIMIARGYHF